MPVRHSMSDTLHWLCAGPRPHCVVERFARDTKKPLPQPAGESRLHARVSAIRLKNVKTPAASPLPSSPSAALSSASSSPLSEVAQAGARIEVSAASK
jgi:hypothetical protein